jgi:DNA (cytosine-5)-methyltransferase 1
MRGTLLQYFKQLVKTYLPELVFVENVPGVQKVNSEGGPFGEFVETLKSRDYAVAYDIILRIDTLNRKLLENQWQKV